MLAVSSFTYLLLFVVGGIALYLCFLPRLTTDEKLKAFILAILVGPVVGLFMNGAFSTWHDATFASQGDIRGDDDALHLLAALFAFAASGVVLWLARYVSQHRSYADYMQRVERIALAKAQAQEHAQLAAAERRERLLQGQVQLAKLQLQDRVLSIAQAEAQHRADLRAAELAQQEQKLRLAYSSYCSTVDPLNEQEPGTLLDGFRGELRRPRFIRGKLDVELLNQSDDPLVKNVLHGRPQIAMTPDD